MKMSMSMFKRIMAVILVLTMIAGNMPLGARAEEAEAPEKSYLVTTVKDGMTFMVNEPTQFTYRTCPAAEDVNKTVKGFFTISKDGQPVIMQNVATLEYELGLGTGNWDPIPADSFGPDRGFPLLDVTTGFQIKFKEAGDYAVTVTIKQMDGDLEFSDTKNITVKNEPVNVKSTLSEKELMVNRPVDFEVSTDANSDYGKYVLGSFVVKQGDVEIPLSEIAELFYYYNETLIPMENVFGDPSNGFELLDATSKFRIIFRKAGEYNVITDLNTMDGENVFHAEEKIEAKFVDSVLATDLGAQTFVTGRYTPFSFKTAANSNVGTAVKGGFTVYNKDGYEVVQEDTFVLEYLESQNGQWYPLTGEFGPEEGFPLTDNAVSNFKVAFKKAGTYTVRGYIRSLDGKVLCETKAEVTVTDPVAQFYMNGEPVDTNKWYSGDKVVAKVENVLTEDSLAAILVDGTYIPGSWINDGNNNWTREISVAATAKLQYGDHDPVIVKIDNVVPSYEIKSAYTVEDKINLNLAIYVGESGIKTVTINNEGVELPAPNEDGTYSISIPKADSIAVVVTSNAGLSNEEQEPSIPQQEMSVEFGFEGEKYGVGKDGNTYVSAASNFIIKVSGADNGEYKLDEANTVIVDNEGNTVATEEGWSYSEEESVWTAKVSLANGLNGISVTPASKTPDGLGRTGNAVADTTVYAVDVEAPEISIFREGTFEQTVGEVDYFSSNVTYTVKVEDILLDDKDVTVTYTLSDVEGAQSANYDAANKKWTFTISNGQTLTGISVKATDLTGNETNTINGTGADLMKFPVVVDTLAPTVTAYVEGVEYFYEKQVGEDKIVFAVLNPVDYKDGDTAGSATATLVITVSDTNLNESCFAASSNGTWTQEGENWVGRFPITIEDHQTGSLEFDFSIIDLAGYKPGNITVGSTPKEIAEGFVPAFVLNGEGEYSGTIKFDRRAPSSNPKDENGVLTAAPQIELKADTTNSLTAAGRELFDKSFNFDMVITDVSAQENDSGMKSVTWYFNDSKIETNESGKVSEDNNYTINVGIPEDYETDNVVLTVVVSDYVGNQYTYCKTFAVDTKAPVITVTYDNYENYKADGTKYYKADRTATITITDLFLNENSVKLNGEVVQGEAIANGYKFTVPVTDDGEYELKVEANDLSVDGHASKYDESFILDKTAPVIHVVKTIAEGGAYAQTADGVDYYNGTVTYTITVTDKNLSMDEEGEANKAVMYYEYENGEAFDAELAGTYDEATGMYTYEGVIEVKNDQVLTNMAIQVVDNANNIAAPVICEDAMTTFADIDYFGNEGVAMYTGNMVAVDTVAPAVQVEKTGKFVQTYALNDVDRDYYSGDVEYTISVTDNFLNPEIGTCVVTVFYEDGTSEILELQAAEAQEEETKLLADPDSYEYKFTVDGSKVMDYFTIHVVDNANVVAAQPAVTEKPNVETGLTGFELKESVWMYSGNPVVVDKEAPTASIMFSENVKGFYTNGDIVYVILDKAVDGNNEEIFQAAKEEAVSMTIIVTDQNVAIDEENAYGMNTTSAGDWICADGIKVNEKNVLTYTVNSGKIEADGTYSFKLDVDIRDLAGNYIEAGTDLVYAENENQISSNNTKPVIKFKEEGNLSFTLSLDRRRPTSKEDMNAPQIEVIPSIAPVAALADGDDLFDNGLNFQLNINDGVESPMNAGLSYVSWKLTDADGVVENAADEKSYATNVAYSDTLVIPVKILEGVGETNSIELEVTAIDMVGNTIRYTKTFGVDNMAPRISYTVEESRDEGSHDTFFNGYRYITVSVEDLNFVPGQSSIFTQESAAAADGWTDAGENVWTKRVDYVVDGDFSLSAESTDLAKNFTDIEDKGTEYYDEGTVRWLDNFVIDKTAPVIHVTYDPAIPVDTDPQGVQYFDRNRTVTVTINEHNFWAADVTAELTNNALSAWYSNGDIRTAQATFTEGNNYHVNVSYVDMAGNHAVQNYTGPVFSVDLHAPEIVMNKGNLQSGALNPISDDLVLGFTATDNEQNMKNVDVQIYFQGSDFTTKNVSEQALYVKTTENERLTHYIDFDKIEALKANDGIYTVIVTATDYAGHVYVYDTIYFSLNRFGSVFMTDDAYTRDFLNADSTGVAFQNQVENGLVIKEINPNQVWQDATENVEGSLITVAVNGNSRTLEQGSDYSCQTVMQGDGMQKWYEYIYTINPSVFYENGELVDGEYTIFFYSEDKAGNKNTNEANYGPYIKLVEEGTYSGKVSFTLDHLSPIVTVLGIEEGSQIRKDHQEVEINVSDNSPVSISVYIDEKLVEYIETSGGMPINSDWLTYDAATGSYKLNMSEKNSRQDVKVIVNDAAGNEQVIEVNRIMLNQSLWYQYIHSTPALVITGVLALGLIALIVMLTKKRKKAAV